MSFIELHARSAFSFLRGSSSPEELIRCAAKLGMPGMAIVDRDGFYGSARANFTGRDGGVRAMVGTELTMEDESVIPLLVTTRTGYQNLCQLLTRAKLRTTKGQSRVLWSELPEFAEGLIALTGDEEGPVRRALLHGGNASEQVGRLKDIFGCGNVFVEIQRHFIRGETVVNRQLVDLAALHRLPLLASNGVCHAEMAGRMLLDAFTSLRHHTHLDAAGLVLAANSQRHLKGDKEMRGLFADLPKAIINTQRLAERLEYTLENLGYEFPNLPVEEGHNQDSYLKQETFRGAREMYHGKLSSKIKKQLDHELAVIRKLGFSGYFLIVWDLVKYARGKGILIQGRGSAANSAVCFCLGITAADPVKYKLLFERFLSEGSKTWPDIDLDLPSGDLRESVIQEVYRRFAPHGAAMTANVITYRGRSAVREMGKVLNLPEDVVGRFSELYANGDFPHTLKVKDQLRQAGMPAEHPRLGALIRLYHQAYGLPRHLGQHSGGMVLCSKGLDKMVPLEPASMPGRVVVQWDKDDCEDLGIIKVDLLGLGMMAVMQDTFEICRKRRGEVIELYTIPLDDTPTFEMMQKADTIGVFQIESRAQMATLPRMKPVCFYDVVIEVAIIRPGPIVGNLVHPYLKRRSKVEEVEYIHPDFEDILKRTLGVPLFQEQILSMAMKIAGFSGAEAAELRRAMSFHRSEERMQKVMHKLRAAMEERKIDLVVQERVVGSIQSFALYGFPESHAISFGTLAYVSTWLKVHRAAEFYASLLNNQPMGFYSSSTLIRDAKHHGIRIKPVCIIHSHNNYIVEDDHTLRLGFKQIRGLRKASAEHLVAERERKRWQDIEDFLQRCRLDKRERRLMAEAGALNELGLHRRSALWQVEETRPVDDLFSHAAALEDSPLPPMSPVERLRADYHTQHLTVGRHPMSLYRAQLPKVSRATDLPKLRHGQSVTIAGLVICRQRPGTAKGNMFISLEDETGIANAFVPSAIFETNRLVITQEVFLQIKGHLQIIGKVISVCASRVEGLPFDASLGGESHDFR